jgi:hypothetical protein
MHHHTRTPYGNEPVLGDIQCYAHSREVPLLSPLSSGDTSIPVVCKGLSASEDVRDVAFSDN